MVNLFQSICFKFYPGFPTRGNIFRKLIVARFGGRGKVRGKIYKSLATNFSCVFALPVLHYFHGGFVMKNTMEYKGYVGSIEFSESDGVFFGKVQGIRSLISYEGTNASELIADFHGAVDDYLALCKEEGHEPEAAYKGSLNVRLGGELHKRAAIYAISQQQSLNSFIEEAVRDKLAAVNA